MLQLLLGAVFHKYMVTKSAYYTTSNTFQLCMRYHVHAQQLALFPDPFQLSAWWE